MSEFRNLVKFTGIDLLRFLNIFLKEKKKEKKLLHLKQLYTSILNPKHQYTLLFLYSLHSQSNNSIGVQLVQLVDRNIRLH